MVAVGAIGGGASPTLTMTNIGAMNQMSNSTNVSNSLTASTNNTVMPASNATNIGQAGNQSTQNLNDDVIKLLLALILEKLEDSGSNASTSLNSAVKDLSDSSATNRNIMLATNLYTAASQLQANSAQSTGASAGVAGVGGAAGAGGISV